MDTTEDYDVDPDAEEFDENSDFVTFDMAGERYAFPMRRVQEIIRMPTVVKVPLGPPSLEGLANLRGRVLPVVSLRRCCAMEPTGHDETTRVIVVDGGVPLGFVVDRVSSVISIDPQQMEDADSVQATVNSDVLVGVIKSGEGEMTTVLDVDRLIGSQFARLTDKRGGRDIPATRLADEFDAEADLDDTLELVSFAVEGQEYALPIDQVQEIVQAPESVSHVPNADGRVLGVIDLRGRLLPVVSLRQVFGLPVTPLEPQNRIVVVSIGGGVVGVVMDTVREVLRVPHQLVAPLPSVVAGEGRKSEVESVCRLEDGKRLVSVLSVNRMFDSPEVRNEIADYRREDEPDMSDERGDDVDDDGRGDEELFVVFRLDGEEYAVDVDTVQEIIRVPEALIRVPKSYDFVEGLVNLRGTVLPVVDLRTRLGLGRTERDERQRIVVLIIGGVRTGFIVDSVAEVARVGRNVLEPAPELSAEQARVVSRVANLPEQQRMLLLVQVDQLLAAEQADQAAELCMDADDDALVGV
ncbi:chemotaxis protein CheW [Actinoplanes derwentensis]|uniref:Chemotaxis protein CheW n=1 Tax=Actinoplanes derwentensis TaxID=113562 RepID=A0A1H2D5H4_9ACTN|nr:chemotaxis protein CheW [Actinoplanes derwentensis]GID90367.1 chemotaxis protein CheW [Actinoplanes derwentensis]SDT78008.1 purine-binding chemotaxis protein CheW [Actinoplanes derwentensis]